MAEKKLYSDVRFVRIEKLRGRAQIIAKQKGLTEGLALLKTSISSLPEYEIVPIEGDPLEAIKSIALEDGITREKLTKALKTAFKK